MQHSNKEISSQAQTILDMKDQLTGTVKLTLMELSQELKKSTKKDATKTKIEKTKTDKIDRTPKQVRIVGSFLNRNIETPTSSVSKPKNKEDRKLTPLPPEPDSQDYVIIKSDVKLDVNRLTEHQLEAFKRRRDDIPALYNDLSQSSSRDTQDLQQWFDEKSKRSEVPAVDDKKATVPASNKGDPNKENKIDKITSAPEEKVIEETIVSTNGVTKVPNEKSQTELPTPNSNLPKSQDPVIESTTTSEPSTLPSLPKPPENKATNSRPKPPVINPHLNIFSDHSYHGTPKPRVINLPSKEDPIDPIAKKLNFESLEEFPNEDKDSEESSTTDESTSSKGHQTRSLNSVTRGTRSQNESATPMTTRTSNRRKSKTPHAASSQNPSTDNSTRGKGSGRPKRALPDPASSQSGRKRKISSDSDSASSERGKRLRKSSRSPSGTPSDTESKIPLLLDKRTESEMSRLRIDMVFDGPLPPRRRSKYTEDAETTGKKQSSSDENKSSRAKAYESRSADNTKRNSDTAKKRRRGSNKTEIPTKTEESQSKVSRSRSKKTLPESGAASSSQTIVDDEEPPEDSISPSEESTKSPEVVKDDPATSKKSKEPHPLEIPVDPVSVITETVPENDLDEVVESSQDSVVSSKKAIVKMLSANDLSIISELPVDKILPRASSPIEPSEVPETAVIDNTSDAHEKSAQEDQNETFLDISAIRPPSSEDPLPIGEPKKKPPEEVRTSTQPATKGLEPAYNFSSPKNPAKRLMKPKTFGGRAAHMLGLVTKLAVLERDSQADKSTIDESETATFKKLKENERLGSPGGSRQEKIFNNMKAADYATTAPGKLFRNLKNDGEKVSPKMDKSIEGASLDSIDSSATKHDDSNGSPGKDRNELPILEWSSANPPSLTASPSASILKRNRLNISDIETDQTTPKRKRVSFTDPPVSKRMGYEIETTISPLKASKMTSRGLMGRRDSPIRTKQTRFRMIQMDAEKSEREEKEELQIASTSEIDLDYERDNELLNRITEDLECTEDLPTIDVSDDIEKNSETRIPVETFVEIEIGENGEPKICVEDCEYMSENEKKNDNAPNMIVEETQTQDDLFNSSEEKLDSPKQSPSRFVDTSTDGYNTSGQNSTLESFRLELTGDSLIVSVIDPSTKESNGIECLEETIDVQTLPNLNTTANYEEAFRVEPKSTDIQETNAICHTETLPVTESMFVSQDSQESTQTNMVLAQPELLDSTIPIYPSMIDCQEPIETIIQSLANPLWTKSLSQYLMTRQIRTIGDLARLSEREIVRIPVKGSSRVEFVRRIIGKYEDTIKNTGTNGTIRRFQAPDYLPLSPDRDDTLNVDIDGSGLSLDIRKTLTDVSPISANLKLLGNSNCMDVSIATTQNSEIRSDSGSMEELNAHHRHRIGRTSTTMSMISVDPSVCEIIGDTLSEDLSQGSTTNISSEISAKETRTVGTSMDALPQMETKCVGAQMALEDLLDEIDVKLVLESAVKRTSAETLLKQFQVCNHRVYLIV